MADRNEFEAAVAAVRNAPEDSAAWDLVESLAGDLDSPDEVAALYRDILAGDLATDVIVSIGERAAQFAQEWFGDDPTVIRDILIRVLDLDPKAEWAFQKLTVAFTVSERWDDLLALYDRALGATRDNQRRIRLLDEAAQVAKDVAGQPDKAIAYLQQLLPLAPDDAQVGQSLERLLERHERWADLIALWESRLDDLSRKERERSRARIALCWLENLGDPEKALGAARPLLAESEDDTEACQLLERILQTPGVSPTTREGALDVLRAHYDATHRGREVIRVLELMIANVDPAESQALREEAGARLAELDDDNAAMEQYAALMALTPDSSVTQEKLRQLAQRSGNYARYADGVAAAAAATSDTNRKVTLLAEAARTRLELLDDAAGAIELYQQAFAEEAIGDDDRLAVARRLSELYARADRQPERLAILQQLADLEPSESSRRAVQGEGARLAESLGEVDAALALWAKRIESDASDLQALDSIVGLLETAERWQELIAALEKRVARATTPAQRRADLARVAAIHHDRLSDVQSAIAAWQRVRTECGEDSETVSALADLLAETESWEELAQLLEGASGRETAKVTERLIRLADAYREHLGSPERSLAGYRAALAIDSKHEGALAGLMGLLDNEATRRDAANALAQSFRENNLWDRFLELVEPRLEDADDVRTRLAVLREAADIREGELSDAAGALGYVARAFPLAPADRSLEGRLLRLAESTNHWSLAASALSGAVEALAGEPHEASRIRLELARVLETHLDDEAAAQREYFAVIGTDPGNVIATRGAIRIGARLGLWDQAAVAMVGYSASRERFDVAGVDELEEVAGESGQFEALTKALSNAVDGTDNLGKLVAAEFWYRIATWHRDRLGDERSAERTLVRALELDQRTGGLRDLAALQKRSPDQAYYDTLRRLVDSVPGDLDLLAEAAQIAKSVVGTDEEIVATLTALFGRASAAWRGTAVATGSRDPQAFAADALDRLVDHYLGTDRAMAAVDTLVEASRLPFSADERLNLRLRAAQIASEKLDRAAAIEMYRGVLSLAPTDQTAMDRMADLLEAEGRWAELMTLRKHQLGLEEDGERRLALRIEVARLVGVVEKTGGRIDALRANLKDRPGHAPSVAALCEILGGQGSHRVLADILETEGKKLEEASDAPRAAEVWSLLADVASNDLNDVDRAIAAHRRVVTLAPTTRSLWALANLNLERNQPSQAVPWLENLMAAVSGDERLRVVEQLANALVGAEQTDRAITLLEQTVNDDQPVVSLRTLLAAQYRTVGSWESLAKLLTKSLAFVDDPAIKLEYAREAANIYFDKLEAPDKAIVALEKAIELEPDERGNRVRLGVALRSAGRLEEARVLLTQLVAEFGRRRTPERAAVHVELAKVAQGEGKHDEALAEMEQAAKMDPSNASIQRELAELARVAGNLEQAERTYRALLLVVRRQPPGDDDRAVGVSAVLYELATLAREHGETDQANELLESAVESAVQSDAEVRRIRRSLLAHNETDTLLRILDLRIKATDDVESHGQLLADRADVLEKHLDQPAEALKAVLAALQKVPGRLDLHDRAIALAKTTKGSREYVATVEEVVDKLRRKEDPPLVARLLLKAGEVLELELGDLDAANEIYTRVEKGGELVAEAYFAQARVAGARGDTETQARALDAMLNLAAASGDGEPSAAQVDALYHLSEIFIGTEARRAQGVDLIHQAFEAEPRYAQAGRVLRAAAEALPDDARVMALYERVARNGNDPVMLLDFLERRASAEDATPAQVREAVEAATEAGQPERADALLERAVATARASDSGIGGAVWAIVGLTERYASTGRLEAARDLVYELASAADSQRVDELATSVAELAKKASKLELAAEIYEFLRERTPGAQTVWEPLVALYRELGQSDRLTSVVMSTLPNLVDPAARNALRMQHAHYLVEVLERPYDAVEILRDVLLDDADHLEGGALLESVLRGQGDQEALADFLWQRFEDARDRRNPATVADVGMRLGALLAEMESPDALNVYRSALEIAPTDRDILRAVVAHTDPEVDANEAAVLMEKLLAVETPERGPALASKLYSLREELGDQSGMQRALELGHRAAPDDGPIHETLESWYRGHNLWRPLAEMMVGDAARWSDDPDKAVDRLREAANVFRDELNDPSAAAGALATARALAPTDEGIVAALAAALASSGDVRGAITALTEALDAGLAGPPRVDLLVMRAELSQRVKDLVEAVADLEEAFAIEPARVAQPLVESLAVARDGVIASGDRDAERAMSLRLVQILRQFEADDRAREILVQWIGRAAGDREPLYILRDMDTAIQHWEGVVAASIRLVHIEEGQAQVDAAVRLAEAAVKAERAAEAVPGLELVHQAQPDSKVIRDRLRGLYEASGAHRELANVLMADAAHASDNEAKAEILTRAATIYLHNLNDPSAALEAARQAYELAPEDHNAAMLYVDVLINGGQVAAAAAMLEDAIGQHKKRSPELATLQQRMAHVAAMNGDAEGQLEWLKKAFDVDRKNGEIAAELAQLATEAGDYDLALKPLRAITLMDDPGPISRVMALLWEAKIEHARGNKAKAELWAKKALREDPNFAEAQEFLDQIGE